MKLTTIEAKTLPEAWYLCIKEAMDEGHEYLIDRGSHQGSERKELYSTTIRVEYPGSRPLVPDVPEGVPPPSSMDYVEQYLPYLMTGDKQQGELYTYGEDIDYQLQELIRMYKEDGFGTNQACMSIGSKGSIFLEHSQCLRVVDTRVWRDQLGYRNGEPVFSAPKLTFYVYFRSWDLWAGFPSNLAAIQILKEYVASGLGVEDGELIAYSKGLHLYSHHWKVANMVLRR